MPKCIRIPHFRIPRKLKKEWKKSPFASICYREWFVSSRESWTRKVLCRKLRKLCSFGNFYADKLYNYYGF